MINQELHKEGKTLRRRFERVEKDVVGWAVAMQRTQAFRDPGYCRGSLFTYLVEILKYPNSVASYFVTVANKAIEVPALLEAIQTERINVAKASRLVSSLNKENAEEIISMAEKTTYDGAEDWLREKGFLKKKGEKVELSDETYKLVQEVRRLMPKKLSFDEAVKLACQKLLESIDPVRKAERAHLRKIAKQKAGEEAAGNEIGSPLTESLPPESPLRGSLLPNSLLQDSPLSETSRVSDCSEGSGCVELPEQSENIACAPPVSRGQVSEHSELKRTNPEHSELKRINPEQSESRHLHSKPTEPRQREALDADTLHAVNLRDGRRCCFQQPDGSQCATTKFTQVHHIVRIKDGGSDELSNLTTLCWFHHDLIHQLELPLPCRKEWARRYGP